MGKIIAGNFKTNLTRSATHDYANRLSSMDFGDAEVYIFPSSSSLIENKYSNFIIGAQNAYCASSGAYTGEIGLDHLREFGIESIIIGHSERRAMFGDDNAMCKRKFDFFAKENMKIFFCIGESLEIREKGFNCVEDFLHSQLCDVDLGYENLIVAYEPIWAIGSSNSASVDEISKTHLSIKKLANVRVVYGGSVNANNSKEILECDGVDGVLVGGASIDIDSFSKIIRSAK